MGTYNRHVKFGRKIPNGFGKMSENLRPTVIGFFFFRGSLVTRCEAPDGIRSFSGGWPTVFLQYFDAVGWVF